MGASVPKRSSSTSSAFEQEHGAEGHEHEARHQRRQVRATVATSPPALRRTPRTRCSMEPVLSSPESVSDRALPRRGPPARGPGPRRHRAPRGCCPSRPAGSPPSSRRRRRSRDRTRRWRPPPISAAAGHAHVLGHHHRGLAHPHVHVQRGVALGERRRHAGPPSAPRRPARSGLRCSDADVGRYSRSPKPPSKSMPVAETMRHAHRQRQRGQDQPAYAAEEGAGHQRHARRRSPGRQPACRHPPRPPRSRPRTSPSTPISTPTPRSACLATSTGSPSGSPPRRATMRRAQRRPVARRARGSLRAGSHRRVERAR